jgi:phytoene/squalene synthetase
MGIRAFEQKYRMPIYGIYGFVRYADEIVDTFHDYDKATLLAEFRAETYKAIERKISLNPVLDSFQEVVHTYGIGKELIDAFLDSMEMDLASIQFDDALYKKYIYGSAEVVGLMCLRVFTMDNPSLYEPLIESARSLGSAFQKVNFLRDLQDDFAQRARTYFPDLNLGMQFDSATKRLIEADIKNDFKNAYDGIRKLPKGSRLGVLTAYWYYHNLLKKIVRTPAENLLNSRVRISNFEKLALLCYAIIRNKLRTSSYAYVESISTHQLSNSPCR